MRVALIAPGKKERFAVQEPLNLGYIASYLEKNNVEVRIIDQLAQENVKREISKFEPDIAGITATTPLIHDAYKIADKCKKDGILTVIGGPHVSVLPEEALQHVDIVVKGEGELALLDIVKSNIRSGVVSYPYIKDIDDIPPPARHLMKMDFYLRSKDRLKDTYLYFVPPHTKVAAMLTSRGCPFSCTFCHNTWGGIPYRFNSAKRVISEIDDLIRVYGVEAIFFIEDNFFVKKSRLKKICELMKMNKFEIIWGCNARVTDVSESNLQIVKDAGCKQVTFGFESGSQRILDILNKGTTVEQNQKAIDLCKKVGVIPQGTFMIGNPTETIEDIKKTQQFIMESGVENPGICITTPFPGTELWNWCDDEGLIPESLNWSDFTYDNVPIPACDTIPPEELQILFNKIADEMSSDKPINFSDILKTSFSHPLKTSIKVMKNPLKISKIARRLKIR